MNQQTTRIESTGTEKASEMTITYPEAVYLKGAAENYGVKVSYRIVNGRPVIYIRDFEFTTFRKALECLQHIVEREVVSESSDEVLQ